MFYFKIRQVQFGFASGQKGNAGAVGREPDRQTFTDASTATCNEHALVFNVMHLL